MDYKYIGNRNYLHKKCNSISLITDLENESNSQDTKRDKLELYCELCSSKTILSHREVTLLKKEYEQQIKLIRKYSNRLKPGIYQIMGTEFQVCKHCSHHINVEEISVGKLFSCERCHGKDIRYNSPNKEFIFYEENYQ